MEDVLKSRTTETPSSSVASSFIGGATSIDRAAVESLQRQILEDGTKGLPTAAVGCSVGELAERRGRVLDGDFPMPLMVLRGSALDANISAMAEYCRAKGVWLSPHGKTTMAPQLFQRQIDAGAWAITAATPAHLRLYRRFGVQRILYANELVEPSTIGWLAEEFGRSPALEVICLVDSVDGARVLSRALAGHRLARPLPVLIEVGHPGGRCGVRDLLTARTVAEYVDGADELVLWGVECFEGLMGDDDGLGSIDEFLAGVRDIAVDLLAHTSLRERSDIVITAGGSAYFDRVISAFVDGWVHPTPARLVLRSGCYITQDGGFYQQRSPLHGRAEDEAVLRDGIEIWSTVLSRPEPGLLICSMGRRDAPQDMGLPQPVKVSSVGGVPVPLAGATVIALSDQHAHIAVDPKCQARPGDLIGCSISHPCTAFDRWRVLPVVDDGYRVRDAVLTFF